jgi:hypothetical protein
MTDADHYHDQDDAQLAARIVVAIKDVDAATATRNEKAVAAGKLLAEAQRRHPGDKAFAKFLEQAGGIQLRRARDLIAFAVGRKDFERHRIENATAQQRHRDKLKAEKEKAALPKPDPQPKANPKPKPKPHGRPEPEQDAALRNAASVSASALRQFEDACRIYLPKLNEADLKKAVTYFSNGAWKPKTNKEAA